MKKPIEEGFKKAIAKYRSEQSDLSGLRVTNRYEHINFGWCRSFHSEKLDAGIILFDSGEYRISKYTNSISVG